LLLHSSFIIHDPSFVIHHLPILTWRQPYQ
jgi:hypothetical protein